MNQTSESRLIAPETPQNPIKRKLTSEIVNRDTSATLVDFQPRENTLPDWRIQIQNKVRSRRESSGSSALAAVVGSVSEDFAEQSFETESLAAKALKRVEASRAQYTEPKKPEPVMASKIVQMPFQVPVSAKSDGIRPTASVNTIPKPRLVSSLSGGELEFDTSKLPVIPEPAPIATSFDSFEETAVNTEFEEAVHITTAPAVITAAPDEHIAENTAEIEEIDDIAPLSTRFTAGLFDFAVSGVLSLIIASPVLYLGGDWFSVAGVFGFAAIVGLMKFVYMTIALGLYGRTLGMVLCRLELIDANTDQYPTFHQAAVSSSVYLLSLGFLGAGFLTALLNDERRALHDLMSNTIIVREI